MGRRKHAWTALYEELYGESPRDPEAVRLAERDVELAVTEEFLDDFYARIERLMNLFGNAEQSQVLLGMELLLLELRRQTEEIL